MGVGADNGHTRDVNCLRFSNDGRYLASGSDDNLILIWEVKPVTVMLNSFEERLSFKPVKRLSGHGMAVMDLNWSSCDRYLVSGGSDKRVFLWNVEREM
jgi:protein HIRA/HIR1